MEVKKSPKANLENFKKTFTLIGLFVTLTLIYFVINASKPTKNDSKLYIQNGTVIDEENMPITKQPEPVVPQKPITNISNEIVQVVPDYIHIKDNFNFNFKIDDSLTFDEQIPKFTILGEDSIQKFASIMPEFPGGQKALISWIGSHVVYPPLAIENNIEGTVYLRFVVNKQGEVSNVEIQRGVDPILDKEAVRVIKSLPKFKPGIQSGRPVSVWMSVPIVFQLNK